MSSRFNCLTVFLVVFLLGFGGAGAEGQAAQTAAASPATMGTLHGHITDPTGALIPGAKVTVSTAQGKVLRSVTADAAGGYAVRGLAAGSYVIESSYPGFAASVSAPIALTAGQTKNVDIKMAIEAAQQQVVVTDEGTPQVSVEADDNASAIVIKGKDLEALSDDPDELQNELQALAGPAAGPNGGQIYIDGFTAGELPPKSAIREIRINQNPFSAEFDRLGYGRIEILTKPGSDQFHGRAFLMGNDDSFNTGNPFTTVLPAYHSVMYNGTVSGPISKNASFFLSAEQRDNQNDSVYQATTAVLSNGLYAPGILSGSIFSPATHTNISPRVDLQLGEKNTLTLRYQFYRENETNNSGSSVALPTTATNQDTIEHAFQVEDSQVVNDHIVNETRFQYLRDLSSTGSLGTAPQVSVPGYFSGGSSTSQTERDHGDHLELQNITTMTVGGHAIKFGTRVRDNRDANTTDTYFNGNFEFASVADYVAAMNQELYTASGGTSGAACISSCLPEKLTYYIGNENALGNVFDGALFVQDDWKKNKFLTLSGGVRWETQNHVADHDDWGPRLAFAYALDGHKRGTQTKTVLRGGYGFFYNRLGIGTLMSAERYNGRAGSQEQIVVNNPTCFNSTSLSTAGSNCAASGQMSQIDTIARSYHSPVDEQFGISVERQLTKTATLTGTYLRTLGVHQNATIDANAYLPDQGTVFYNSTTGPTPGVRPDPQFGPIDETFPEAVYKQNEFIASVNARLTARLSLTGFYTLNMADADTGTASNSYDLMQDYGRASWAARNQIFAMGNYNGPWGLTFNPFLIAQSGKPFDIVTAEDLTGDNFIGQDRPTYASAASPAAAVVTTSYGTFNTDPQPGETLIPANMGTGPAAVAMNLRVSRAFGLGPEVESSASGHGNHGGGGGGFGGLGGPFGGGGHGGPFGGGPNTGRKYSLTFSAQALNLFNDIDYGTPNGTVTTGTGASRFGESTSLAGGIFSSGAAARRVFLQAALQF